VATVVLAHGAWSSAWAWKKVRPLMAAAGHQFFTPSYTGLGERSHLASPSNDLETHIADVLGVLECEELGDVVLMGHSYGGMVATGVADRARERIAKLIYLDAHVPRDGESLFDLNPERRLSMTEAARTNGEGWKLPINPMPPDTPQADQDWALPRRMPQPIKTFEQKLRFHNGELTLPRHYIYCTRRPPDDRFRPFYERAKREGWGHDEIDASHNPHITAPDALAVLLDRVAK
jgi:pimeloyl-ACP methyl ester carboxylesterase